MNKHEPADAGAPQERAEHYPIRAHVEGCQKSLRVPVDLCDCGGRDFTPSAPAAHQETPEPLTTPESIAHDICVRHNRQFPDMPNVPIQTVYEWLIEAVKLGAPARAAEWQPDIKHHLARLEFLAKLYGHIDIVERVGLLRDALPPGALAGDSNIKR